MKLTFHGHATITCKLNDGTNLIIDPWITDNPASDLDVNTVPADYILITHGHSDHSGDALAIAKRTGAPIIAMSELAKYFRTQGVTAHRMNLGTSRQFKFGKVEFVNAQHSSSYEKPDGTLIYAGKAAGLVIQADKQTIYHMGDTALFSDMKLISAKYDIDVLFIPIGGNFTMGPEEAEIAAKWIHAKTTVPIHYNTFPLIKQNATAFIKNIPGGKILNSGESL